MYVLKDKRGLAPYPEYIKRVSFVFGSDRAIETVEKSKAKKFQSVAGAEAYIIKYSVDADIERL